MIKVQHNFLFNTHFIKTYMCINFERRFEGRKICIDIFYSFLSEIFIYFSITVFSLFNEFQYFTLLIIYDNTKVRKLEKF